MDSFLEGLVQGRADARTEKVTVRYTGENSCYVSLPERKVKSLYASQPSTPLVLELRSSGDAGFESAGQVWHVAWGGTACLGNHLEISKAYAECLALPEGSTVSVKALPEVLPATSVSVEPNHIDDWEIVEAQAQYIEDTMLSQVGVAEKGSAFPVWVRGQGVIRLRTASCSPTDVVRLTAGAEVIVAPRPRPRLDGSRPLIPWASSEHTASGDAARQQSSASIRWLRVQRLQSSQMLSSPTEAAWLEEPRQPDLRASMHPSGCVFVNAATAAHFHLAAGSCVHILDTKSRLRYSPLLAVSEVAANGHICISSAVLVKLGISDHLRLGLQQTHAPSSLQQPGTGWTVVLHAHPMLAAPEQNHSFRQPTRSQEMYMQKGRPQTTSSQISNRLGDVHLEILHAGKLLEAWLGHQLRLSLPDSNLLTSAAAPSSVTMPANSRGIPLTTGMVLAVSLGPAEGQLKFASNDTSVGRRPIESSRPETDRKKAGQERNLQADCQLSFELELCRNGQQPSKQHLTAKAAAGPQLIPNDQSAALAFNAESQGRQEPSEPATNPTRPALQACISLKQIRSGEVAVELGYPMHHGAAAGYDGRSGINLAEQSQELEAQGIISRPGSMCSAAEQALHWLLPCFAHHPRSKLALHGSATPGGLLLCGTKGSGKTSVLKALSALLEASPACLAACVWQDCRSLAGGSMSIIQQALLQKVDDARRHMPAMLVLDDLGILCPSSTQETPEVPRDAAEASMVSWVSDLIDSLRPAGQLPLPVVLCATCNDAADLPAALKAAGRLDHIVKLPALGSDDRAQLLQTAFQVCLASVPGSLLQDISAKAEGYTAADLETLRDRALHVALSRMLAAAPQHQADGEVIGREDLEKAQQGFSPAASWGAGQVGTSADGPQGWQDVGGLQEVQAAMKESLELPAKYPKLIARAPLRLRTGMLLYGPPGCGKTHLVSAAVAACGLRCISVKGPEVLNKYIGASEAAVRDLFRRASAAAPCALFFDEFDAIAPQRGHDSTGVTDRVVNQLLTELDGVEGLTGVFVIGATSRPDLLDAALLRPGRLDRLFMCPFPAHLERIAILKALARQIPFSGQVDLETIGRMTDGYTGADLSALLSEAQLAAVHDVLDTPISDHLHEPPKLSQKHLDQAFRNSRPSTSAHERVELMRTLTKFQQGRQPVSQSVAAKGKGKKATLA